MSILIGYDFYGLKEFSDDSPSLRSVKYIEVSGTIVDEISIREKTNQGMSNVKDSWQVDSMFISKFVNTLESGNLANEGVKIVKFKILRREIDSDEDIYLGEVEYNDEEELEFVDGTQPNKQLVYSIIPVGENGLDGQPKETSIESDFCGVWIVDKDNPDNILVFDKAIGQNVGNVDSVLNQNRTQIDTFSQYPQFYYGTQNFESFTLTTVILPEDGERIGKKYKDILNKFILDHRPKIVKTDTGRVLVADISNLRSSTPITTWENFSYTTIQVDVTECENYEDFMKNS